MSHIKSFTFHLNSVLLLALGLLCTANTVHDGARSALATSLQALVASAAAQEINPKDVPVLALPEQSIWSKLYHNYLGFPRKHIWFVIADSAATLPEASQKLREVSKVAGDLQTEVYRPAGSARGYFVIVGRPMKADEARALVEKLNKSAVVKRARAWSPLVKN